MSKKRWVVLLGVAILSAGALALRVRQVARRTARAASAAQATPRSVAASLDPAEVAYDGQLGAGWKDWGFGPHELPSTGPAKVVFAGFGAIVLQHAELRANYGGVAFQYKAPSLWPEFLAVGLKRGGSADAAFPQVAVDARNTTPLADGWRQVFVEWSQLNPANLAVDRIAITARSTVLSDWVLLDKIVLTKPLPGASVGAPTRDVELKISCGAALGPISPLIYGGAAGDWESGQSAERIGGNLTSRLNWDAGNLWNTGNDWFFENGKVDSTVWDWLDADARRRAPAALTVPMIGWVAKDATSVGFPRAKFRVQRKFDEYRSEAGDGYAPDGSKIKPGSPEQTSIPASPAMIGHWIRTVREKDRARGARSASMYILDNEPSLWNSTHRDVHPEPVSYDELLDRTIRYATEIRSADPDGLIAGPAEWGWRGYFFSGKDQAQDPGLRSDRRAHGDIALIPWYLQKLAEHERTAHTRLLDVLDVHFYPAAEGLYGAKARVDPASAELRIRSTRALWDPTYLDESWINESIALIPRLKKWVAENYPGRQISIGEWSFGADEHISGGIATAEALGRFGQQGLDAAFYWNGPKKGTATFWAFRAYRNFDGKGGRFLDVALPTREADKVSLFASRDDSGSHIVAILVNRDPAFAVHAQLELPACGRPVSRRVFVYGPGSTSLTEANDPGAHAVRAPITLDPYSFAVVDLQIERP
jgi:hypothetical protein